MTPEQKRQYNAEYYRNNPHLRERARERKRKKKVLEERKKLEEVQKNGLGFDEFCELEPPTPLPIAQKEDRQMARNDDTDSMNESESPDNLYDEENKIEQPKLKLVEKEPIDLEKAKDESKLYLEIQLPKALVREQPVVAKNSVSEKIDSPKNEETVSKKVSETQSTKAATWSSVSDWFQIALILAILVCSGFIVVSENSLRLSESGHTWPLLMAIVLEGAIIGLSIFSPNISFRFSTPAELAQTALGSFKFIGFKLALAALVGFSFWISMVSEEVSGTEKIASVSKSETAKDIDRQIEITLAALADFQKKGESGNIAKTQNELRELRAVREKSLASKDVQQLKSVYEDEKNMRMASKAMPLMINILFAHLLGMAIVRRRKS